MISRPREPHRNFYFLQLIEADWNVEFKNLYDRLYFKLKDLIMEVHGMKSYLDTIQSGYVKETKTGELHSNGPKSSGTNSNRFGL